MLSELKQIVAGSSLKAGLDLDWDNPNERNSALTLVLGVLESLETFLEEHREVANHPQVQASWEAAQQVKAQDVEIDDQGIVKLRQGVAKERHISIQIVVQSQVQQPSHLTPLAASGQLATI